MLILFAAGAISAGAADRSLVVIEHPAPESAAELIGADVMVVRDMERYLIEVVTPEELALLSDEGLVWNMLDPSMEGKTYYTVTMRNESQLPELEKLGRVLRSDRFDAVVEADFDEANRIAWSGFEIAKVFVRPIRPPRSVTGDAPTWQRLAADPVIQSIVDAVSTTRVSRNPACSSLPICEPFGEGNGPFR